MIRIAATTPDPSRIQRGLSAAIVAAIFFAAACLGPGNSVQGIGLSAALGQDQACQLWIQLPADETATEVSLQINSTAKIGAIQFDIVFDPKQTFEAIEPAGLLPSALLESNLVEPGRLRVAMVSSEPISGIGALAKLKFAAGSRLVSEQEFRLENLKAWDLDSLAAVAVTPDKTRRIGDVAPPPLAEPSPSGSVSNEPAPATATIPADSPPQGTPQRFDRDEVKKIVLEVLGELQLYPKSSNGHWFGLAYFLAGFASSLLFLFVVSSWLKAGKA